MAIGADICDNVLVQVVSQRGGERGDITRDVTFIRTVPVADASSCLAMTLHTTHSYGMVCFSFS